MLAPSVAVNALALFAFAFWVEAIELATWQTIATTEFLQPNQGRPAVVASVQPSPANMMSLVRNPSQATRSDKSGGDS